jgi:hypothetical protein
LAGAFALTEHDNDDDDDWGPPGTVKDSLDLILGGHPARRIPGAGTMASIVQEHPVDDQRTFAETSAPSSE